MICNRNDLDACIDWLDREGKKPARNAKARHTYRGRELGDTIEAAGFSCQVAPWLVEWFIRRAEEEGT